MLLYPVMEQFYTLQGEGAYAGHAAYFIRLAGCDVGCVWCDVKESWPADMHPRYSVTEIVSEASAFPGRLCVITGGEPTMYDLAPLTKSLHDAGFSIHIETSGSGPLSGDIDWVTLSPKKFKKPLDINLPQADELKIIMFNQHDFEWAEEWAGRVRPDCRLYLQPEWGKAEKITPLILSYIKENPKWQLSLQTHKYLDIP